MQATTAMKPPWLCLLGSKVNLGFWAEIGLKVWGENGLKVICLELLGKARAEVETSVFIRLLLEIGVYSRFMIIALPLGCTNDGISPALSGEVKIKAAATAAAMIVVSVFFVCPFFISLSPLFFIPLIANARRVPEREIV